MPEDAALLAKVKEALSKDEALRELHLRLHLRAVGGVIFLDGEVADEDERKTLEAAIRQVEGVKWVQDRLQVHAGDTPEDRDPHRHPHG